MVEASFKRGRQDFWNVEFLVSGLLGAGIMKPYNKDDAKGVE